MWYTNIFANPLSKLLFALPLVNGVVKPLGKLLLPYLKSMV